jgi:hypothetical protein
MPPTVRAHTLGVYTRCHGPWSEQATAGESLTYIQLMRHSRHPGPARRRIATAVSVVSAVLIAASPASAGTRVLEDRPDDVLLVGTEQVVPSPSADILAVKGAFSRTGIITVTIIFADLQPLGTQWTQAFIVIDGDYYGGAISTSPRNRQGTFSVGSDSGTLPCPMATHRVNYRRDFIRVAVPRRCLTPVSPNSTAGPRTPVRVGAAASRHHRDYYDVAGADGTTGDTYARQSALIKRG